MNVNDDSIELLQEYLDTSRTHALCQQISLINDRLWGISLRECSISNDKNYEKLMNAIKKCKSLRYLNLNLSVANTFDRINLLTGVLSCLTYLDTLCLHSCELRDEGFKLIYYSIVNLKHFRSLDIGDNQLTDNSVMYIRELIHRREQTKGLYELILSANPKITPKGWTKILIAVAASASLRYFHLDYNTLDDSCGYLILAILSANHSLQVLDLEHTGLTSKTAKLLLFLIKNYRLSIKTLNLLKNPIGEEYQQEIYRYFPNEYDFDTSQANGFRRTDAYKQQPVERPSRRNSRSGGGAGSSQIFDIRLKDQSKLKQFLSNANKLNSEGMDESTRLERTKALERDYLEMMRQDEATEKQQQYHHYQKQQQQLKQKNEEFTSLPGHRDEYEDNSEILHPYDDLRYKTHNILPFNIRSY